ncbi:manganese-dependent inorganic pyrophosphatase [Rahnella laticis]|uniref:manganese-dependent inorganic pyrophosphatase n=1 Tax=Rahnella laticis TaxID=2787622 RepID=UPI0018A32C3D|nr:manganese-dependent inorganic pyrophosphatase [Rahnella laticis]MBF7994970.1 manganese-dependent inorganic pyrophosphatase [Rahnella laticis]
MIYVFGHLNPDSDTICSALITADWLNHLGKPATPFRLGDITPETAFILQQAGVSEPALLECALDDKDVWLVDFTDAEQGPESLLRSNIIGIIDHHRLGTVMTKNPPDVWIRSVGCCATILWQILSFESVMPVSASQATLLLGALLSDTVALTSSTTTVQDKAAAQALTELSGLDYDVFVKGLLTAKTNISGLSPARLLMRDAKSYRLNALSVLVSQIEVESVSSVEHILADLIAELTRQTAQGGFDFGVVAVTDIFKRNSTLYFSDNNPLQTSGLCLPGVISRKKDILPWLTEAVAASAGAK